VTDQMQQRLRAADPARSFPPHSPSAPWILDLTEAAMNTQTQSRPTMTTRRWQAVAAAAVVTAIGVGSYFALHAGSDRPLTAAVTTTAAATTPAARTSPVNSAAPVHLALPPNGPSMQTCVQFSAQTLAPMETAFDGIAAQVTSGKVMIDVGHWYRGGDAWRVELIAPAGDLVTSEGSFKFEQGHRYLVTATAGVVNSCGFTREWSAAGAATFQQAFAN
jgi:hypothetical protein